MKSKFSKMIPAMAVLLLFVLLGGPQLAMAQSTASSNVQPPRIQCRRPRPSRPAPPSRRRLPEAPQSQQAVGTPALPQDAQPPAQQDQSQQTKEQAPVGAAAAEKGVTAGGAASKPAGNAIAPAKQRQVRSLLHQDRA